MVWKMNQKGGETSWLKVDSNPSSGKTNENL